MALNAIITAGGQLPRELCGHSSSRVKALLKLHEKSLLEYAVHALQDSGLFRRIALVGNAEVAAVAPHGAEHVAARDTLVANIQAGFEHLGGAADDYLIISPDLPFIDSAILREFAAAAREQSEIGFAYVTREDFMAHFPGAPNTFAKVDGAELTMGSCFYMTGHMLQSNIPLAHDFFRARKSPFKLAMLLGLPVVFGFVTGRLRLEQLEKSVGRLTGGEVRALRMSHPGIAYDIDSLANYTHALQVLAERAQQAVAGEVERTGQSGPEG